VTVITKVWDRRKSRRLKNSLGLPALSAGESGEMRAYPLRTRLTHMELRTDRAYRWIPARREIVAKRQAACTCKGLGSEDASGRRPPLAGFAGA